MKHSLFDFIAAKDGSLSMTKLAACTGHAMFAIAFYKFQIYNVDSTYDSAIWLMYGGFALGHAIVDKTSAQVAAFKDRQQDVIENTTMPANTKLEDTTVGDVKSKVLSRTKPAAKTTGGP